MGKTYKDKRKWERKHYERELQNDPVRHRKMKPLEEMELEDFGADTLDDEDFHYPIK